MSLKFISAAYDVPAEKGQRIVYTGLGYPRPGEIVGSYDASIQVVFDDKPDEIKLYHPTWNVHYGESEELCENHTGQS